MKDIKFTTFGSLKQLELLRFKCKKFAPTIYQLYDVYLKILRSLLRDTIRTSIVNLITARSNDSFKLLTKDQIKEFQLTVDELVIRCSSLLTVESLNLLGKELEKENKILLENARNQISNAINKSQESKQDEQKVLQENYQKDINLSFELPIGNPPYINDWFVGHDFNGDAENPKEQDKYIDPTINAFEQDKNLTTENDLLMEDEDRTSLPDNNNKKKLDVLKSLFSIASQVFDGEPTQNISSHKSKEDNEYLKDQENEEDEVCLPDNPEDLMEWVNILELALSRRLRNLSQAINVELLRKGIVNSIVPIGILDAVIMGQMSTEYTNPNLLRINVPTNSSAFGEAIDIICLLIRTSEIEFEHHRLRKCRTELQKYHKVILKMIKQYRYWHSRSLAEDIHRNWPQTSIEQSPTHPLEK